jgi:hypothetical protein
MTERPSCAARWASTKRSRIDALRRLQDAWQDGDEDRHANDLGTLSAYGLGFDYVAPDTFADQKEGYWRYQLSSGGPGDEFRFYAGGCGEQQPYRVGYAFLDFFDGHEKALTGNDLDVILRLWTHLQDAGATEAAYRKAMRGADR